MYKFYQKEKKRPILAWQTLYNYNKELASKKKL
jgi:hypothetical protein